MGQLRRLLSHAGEQSCQPVQVHLVAQSNTERRQRVLSIVMVGSSVKITNCGPLPPAPSPRAGEGEPSYGVLTGNILPHAQGGRGGASECGGRIAGGSTV